MNNIKALFQKKLQELKTKPHKRFDNNEDPAAENQFITSDGLQENSVRFAAFLDSYKSIKAGNIETQMASLF